MSQYRTFNAADAVAYARQFAGLEQASELVSAHEVGDGNLNLVFKIFDAEGVSRIVVKQALPYVRCVGESWPLTLDRARLEAQTLLEHYRHCPAHTVKIHHFDPDLSVMVMEDLSDHRIWRADQGHVLSAGRPPAGSVPGSDPVPHQRFLSHPGAEKGPGGAVYQSGDVRHHRRSLL